MTGLSLGLGLDLGLGFGREDGGDGWYQTELDEGELLGPVADDAVLELPQSLELDFEFG